MFSGNCSACFEFQFHLLSASATECKDGTTVFEQAKCRLMQGYRLLAEGRRQNTLYVLDTLAINSDTAFGMALVTQDLNLWLVRLAHVSVEGTKSKVKKRVAIGGNGDLSRSPRICELSVFCKSHGAPIPKQRGESTSQLQKLIRTHVHGSFQMPSFGGSRYYISFIYDCSRYTTNYRTKTNSEELGRFKQCRVIKKGHTGKNI